MCDNTTKTATVKEELVWQFDEDACHELLMALTGTECVPCEGGVGAAQTGQLHYYEKDSGKGFTLSYSWENDFANDAAEIKYAIDRNEVWDEPPMVDDPFVEWLDNSPKDYNAWQVVERAARRVSLDGGTRSVEGEANALSIMSGIDFWDVLQFLADFAEANYERGRRIE